MEPTGQSSKDVLGSLSSLHRLYGLLGETVRDFAIILTDANTRITGWNPGAEQILGWREQEVLEQPAAFIFTPEDRAAGLDMAEIITAVTQGRAADTRWHMKKDGSRFWAEGVLIALRNTAGELEGFGKIVRDATERKQQEEALRAAYRRERSIAVALQRPLTLTIDPHAFPGVQLATHYEPASGEADIGGDFFDAFSLPNGRIALAVADVSGKGLMAASRAVQIKEVLRAFTREYPHSLTQILARLNDYVCEERRAEAHEIQGIKGLFVTLLLVLLDPHTGEMSLASAGAEAPLLLRVSGSVEKIDTPDQGSLPLGVQDNEMYHSVPLRLDRGDILLLTTDGLTEAQRGMEEFLNIEGLMPVAQAAIEESDSLASATTRIVEQIREFAHGQFRDDVCLLLAHRQ